jgi:hypothetical protein
MPALMTEFTTFAMSANLFSQIYSAREDHPLYDSDQPEKARREVDSWDWSWTSGCNTKQAQSFENEQGYTCKTQSLLQICEHALEGCDGCGLVLYCIKNAFNASNSRYYQGRIVALEDQIKVHLKRRASNETRDLQITHHGKSGPAFGGEVFLSMAAEESMLLERLIAVCLLIL